MMKEGDNPLDHTTFETSIDGMAYVLKEHNEIDEELNEEPEYLVFQGTHNDLNLYIIWYGQENPGITLEVVASFAPIVRRLETA